MRLLQEAEDATNNKKLIKSQVEKRRRERMNRSLERLRTMMMQRQQQAGIQTQRRVEKAEILEQTVFFLQNAAKETRAAGRGQTQPFQDGFSFCLQRAVCFLGPEGKGPLLRSALYASFLARLSHADPDPLAAVQRPSACPPYTKASFLQMLRQRFKYKLHPLTSGVNRFAHLFPLPVQQSFLRVPQQLQKQSRLDIGAESGATKRNSPHRFPVSQTLWRPWP